MRAALETRATAEAGPNLAVGEGRACRPEAKLLRGRSAIGLWLSLKDVGFTDPSERPGRRRRPR